MKSLILILMSIFMLTTPAYSMKLTAEDLHWLTHNIYWEARGQGAMGQLFVGMVTLNRVMDKRWPDTIVGVVTQPDQFSWYWDGKSDIPTEPKAWTKAMKAALIISDIYESLDPDHKMVFWYHNNEVSPTWGNNLELYTQVDNHIFYTDK